MTQLANSVYPEFRGATGLKWLESEILQDTVTGAFANGYCDYTPFFNATGGSIASCFRIPFRAVVAASNIQVGYVGYYVNNGNFTNIAYTCTASIQRADPLTGLPTGTPTRITQNGSSTITVASGSALTLCDPINMSFAAGEHFFIINYVPVASGGSIAINSLLTNQTGSNFSSSDLTATGAFTNDQSQTGIGAFCPSIILGTISADDKIAVIGFGDSIMQGANDSAGNGGRGWIGKALYSTNPVINVGVGGSRAQTYATDTAFRTKVNTPVQYARDALFSYGFNDIYSGGFTAQVVEGYITTCIGQLRALGLLRKIIGVTVKPSTTSTDGWLTTTNQTPYATAETNTLSLVNNWILNQGRGNLFDDVFDFGNVFTVQAVPATPNIIYPGPAYAILTDTAGASTSALALRTSSSAIGDMGVEGCVIKVTNGGTDYYQSSLGFRPASPNVINFVAAITAAAPGDSYTIYRAWNSDQAHPNGSGYTAAADAFPLGLVR